MGAEQKLLRQLKVYLKDCKSGILNENEINEEVFSKHLMTSGLPDPDLLIRTSGEIRLSNFMLWQLAYTDFGLQMYCGQILEKIIY